MAPTLISDPTQDIWSSSSLRCHTLSSSTTSPVDVEFAFSCGWTGEHHPKYVPRTKAPKMAAAITTLSNIKYPHIEGYTQTHKPININILLLQFGPGLNKKASVVGIILPGRAARICGSFRAFESSIASMSTWQTFRFNGGGRELVQSWRLGNSLKSSSGTKALLIAAIIYVNRCYVMLPR